MIRELSVTFRDGRLMAAYLYLDKSTNGQVARTSEHVDGMLVDFDDAGRPLGVEFIAPSAITVSGVNSLLAKLGEQPLSAAAVRPLLLQNAGVTAA